MADPSLDPTQPTDLAALASQLGAGIQKALIDGKLDKAVVSTGAKIWTVAKELAYETLLEEAGKAGQLMELLETVLLPFISAFTAPIVGGLFGAEVNAADFARKLARGDGRAPAEAIVESFIKAITGDAAAQIEPGDAGAKRIASAAVQASLESAFNALVPALASDFLPEGVGHFDELVELPEGIIRTLGVGRLVRRALTPYVTVACATPALWSVNKKHRPTLLGATTAAKQIARNPDARETWLEDLRRQGYSDVRIEALLNEQAKFHSVTDLDLLVRAGVWSGAQAEKHLRDQGYEADVAATELQIEKIKRIAAFERAMATAAVDAYVAGRITEGTLGGFITGTTISPQEKAQYAELASARRICSIQPLTPAEAERAVKAKILSFSDYRDALRRDGRTEDAITVLELQLRHDVDKETSIEQHRKDQEAERAKEKAARDAETAKRKAEIAAARALARRGSEGALEAAAVRGLIPIARVREVYDAKYDDDTAAILAADLAARRADYVAQQAAADAARKRAAVRNIDVGALERAVLGGVISVGEFRAHLIDLKFSPADADLLAATVDARLTALADAKAARDHAAALAKIKHIDLGRMETLVRRGHRTLGDYGALLAELGFDDGSRAAMLDLLQLHINEDAAAAQLRADAAARATHKGLTVEQFRRAVIIGAAPITAYQPFLIANGFSADAAVTLLAELQFDRDEAEAARARRKEADSRSQVGKAPLSDVRRAARLGLIPVEIYYGRLRQAGYSDDDIAIESDLLAAEIGHARALQADAEARAAAAPGKGLTLAQLAAAVQAGVATAGDYYGRALALGFSDADATLLTRTLQDTLDTTAASRQRRAELAADGADLELKRADLEKAVRKGVSTLDDYAAWLQPPRYSADDAALLVALLSAELGGGAGPANPGG